MAFFSDNPTVMQSLRRLMTEADMALFAYGCAAHAANLVDKDLARLEPFRSASIDAVTIIGLFTRSSRAMAMLLTNVHQLGESGETVPFLRTYSRTRWVGETASIASVIGSIAALRRTLSDSVRAGPAVVIPPAVTAAVQGAGRRAGMEREIPFLKLLSECVASIEAENAPLSTVAGVFCALRSCLSTSFPDLPVDTRTAVQSSIAARYSLIHDPVLALALYLDPFWVRVRMRGAALEWGGKCFISLRDTGLDSWSGNDGVYRDRLSADLASFLARVEALPFRSDGMGGRPCRWWRLHGEAFPDLRPLAVRNLLLPPSAAGGERSFKVFNRNLNRLRNRLAPDKADMNTRIACNLAQLERPYILRPHRRTRFELDLLVKLGLAPSDAKPGESAAPGGAVFGSGPPDGGAVWEEGGGGGVLGGGEGCGGAAAGEGEDAVGDLEGGGGEDAAVDGGEPPADEGDGAIENVGPDMSLRASCIMCLRHWKVSEVLWESLTVID